MKNILFATAAIFGFWFAVLAQTPTQTTTFQYGSAYFGNPGNNVSITNLHNTVAKFGVTNVYLQNVNTTVNPITATAYFENTSGSVFSLPVNVYARIASGNTIQAFLIKPAVGQSVTITTPQKHTVTISEAAGYTQVVPVPTTSPSNLSTYNFSAFLLVKVGISLSYTDGGTDSGNSGTIAADFNEYVASIPTVTTTAPATTVTNISAVLGGVYTAPTGTTTFSPTERGVVYSTSSAVTAQSPVTGTLQSMGTNATFTGTVSSLQPNTTYYYRAYAKNSTTTYQGALQSFTTCANTPTPTVTTTQNFCISASPTVASLTATANVAGGTIQWYNDVAGNNLLSSSTALTTGTYYVGQTACATVKSNLVAVAVTVLALPDAGTLSGTNTICLGQSTQFTTSSTANSNLWSVVDMSVAEVASNGMVYSLGVGTTNITFTVSGQNICPDAVATRSITVQTPSVAGTISSSSSTICEGASSALSLTGNTGSIQWQKSTNNTTFSNISGATSTSLNTGALSSTTYYRAVVTSGVCAADNTSTETITVDATPVAGTITFNGSASICSGETKALTLTGSTGNIQWQESVSGTSGSYTNILGATSSNYTTAALTSNNYYRAVVSNGVCASVNASAQQISVDATSVAGNITGNATVCFGSTSTLTLNSYTGTIVWMSATSSGGTFTSIGQPNASFTTSAINSNIFYKAQVTNGACPVAYTTEFEVSPVTSGSLGSISAISGPTTATLGTNTYAINQVANATGYVWDMPTGMYISNSSYSNNGATINALVESNFTGGTIKVKATACQGQETSWQTLNVLAPGTTAMNITGTTVVCGNNSGLTYSVPSVTNATYIWSLPTGVTAVSGSTTNSIVVNFSTSFTGGNITCVRGTSIGSATASIFIGGLPTPSSISGPTNLSCPTSNSVANYSISNVTGATSYEWQLPTGMSGTSTTNSISTSYSSSISGIIKVRAIGTCGTSAWKTLAVATVSMPGSISGASVVCGAAIYTISGNTLSQTSQNNLTYSVPNVNGTTYTWTVPTSIMTITSGQNTNSITVEINEAGLTNFTSGVVSVTASVGSCQSAPRTKTITKAVSTITGPTAICGITTATYSVPTSSGSSFLWSLPSWMTPASGYTLSSNPLIVDIAATGTSAQPLTVTIETTCGPLTLSANVGCDLYTQLSDTYCGTTITSFSAGISSYNVQSAGAYKFEITPDISGAAAFYLESTDRWFALTEVISLPLVYNTNYAVKVATQYNGTWMDYGTSCIISTPSMPQVTLSSGFCDAAINSFSSGLSANNITGASMYRFTITPNGSQISYTIDSPDRWFALTEATNMPLIYSTTYDVTVAIQNAGNWGTPGTVCTVTTPLLPATTLAATSCGVTLTSLSSGLSANNIMGASMYRFNITPIGSQTSYTVDSPDRWFALTEATNMQLTYGTVYNVSVAIQNGGTWSSAGSSCSVTTPSLPTTVLSATSCGATLTSLSAGISANNVQGATMYEFHIIDGATLLEYTVQSPDRWIALSEGQSVGQTPQALVPIWDNVYTIKVKVQSGTAWSAYGTECFVNTASPQGIATQDPQLHEEQTEGLGVVESSNINSLEDSQLQTSTWTATATSNPFAHNFQIKLNGAEGISADAIFTAQLTEMNGKLYGQATLSKEQLEAESFGEQLAPGMYLMTLRQGEELRVIRVVKR